jgi:PDZ domain-containing protein
VAVTGALNADGTVNPVGGIAMKVAASQRERMDVLLVPTSNYEEARRVAGDLHVIAVGSLDDAIAALASLAPAT